MILNWDANVSDKQPKDLGVTFVLGLDPIDM